MFNRISLIITTISHLKPIQIFYQCWYRIVKAKPLSYYDGKFQTNELNSLSFLKRPPIYTVALSSNKFQFLNIFQSFEGGIDWNIMKHGKLWNYNLQYCNYLLQEDVPLHVKLKWLRDIREWLIVGKLPLEPYPVSLRVINTIRLASEHKLEEPLIASLHAQIDFLSKRLEYHLLGNHLMENAFALLMGGGFFNNQKWINKAETLLEQQLTEQIYEDGGHFELSPMYHQIILFRLLELVDWYSRWSNRRQDFLNILKETAMQMLTWLWHISFKNGDIPHFNDSTDGVAFPTKWLINYAESLGLSVCKLPLGASGYRSVVIGKYECKIDFAQMGPGYQPGHGHADSLSFVLYYDHRPVLIETGTSSYEIGLRREAERRTSAHNTVEIGYESQSQVYGAFRAGRRAQTKILIDEQNRLSAKHDGYKKKFGVEHQRSFSFEPQSILITDEIHGSSQEGVAYFHLHSSVFFTCTGNDVFLNDIGYLRFNGSSNIRVQSFDSSLGFNLTQPSNVICVTFSKRLVTQIIFN